MGPEHFRRYFAHGAARIETSPDGITVLAPNEFLKRWLQSWVEPILRTILADEPGHPSDAAGKLPTPQQAIQWRVAPDMWDHAGSHADASPAQSSASALDAEAHNRTNGHAPRSVATDSTSDQTRGRWSRTNDRAQTTPHGAHTPEHAHPDTRGTSPTSPNNRIAPAAPTGRWRRPDAARYRLEEFVVGDSNRLAYTACCSLASPEAHLGLRALVLHGPCGLGKTHLLSGVLRRVLEQDHNARVRYVTAEQFANEYIASVKANDLTRFRNRYRGLDLLCIDDVHFLAGKQKTMLELEHTFEALDLAGARVVMASDAHPTQIADFSRRLAARLAGAMSVQLLRPDRATRLRIVEKLALERGLMIDASTVQTIADACVESVREIQGALAKLEALAAHARITGDGPSDNGLISASLARRAVAEDISGRVTRPIRIDVIADVVCRALRVDMSEVLGTGRHKRVVLARSLCAWLSRELTAHSYPEIARALHRPSHSTIVTQWQKVQRQIDAGELVDAGPEFDGVRIADLCERLRNEILRRPPERD
ncbi:MAG: DnaA/Hda family protein [Phycisphaerales bacterium]